MGKEYQVRIIKEGVPLVWDAIPSARLEHVGWDTTYQPECEAKCIYEIDVGLHVKLSCREREPLARYTKFFDDVYKDSCLEFFSAYGNGAYMNIELNAKGTMLCALGADRNKRTPISEIIPLYSDSSAFPITTGTEDGGEVWFVDLLIPTAAMEKIYGITATDIQPGFILKGNFYKCGDETESEHYMMWAPVLTAFPDYHRPEYFGTLLFV